jgi:hypothetical protein
MLLLGGCHASAGDDRPAEAAAKTPGPAGWIDLAAEPADLLADPEGLRVTLGDHSVPASTRPPAGPTARRSGGWTRGAAG